MAQKFLNLESAAAALGLSVDKVNKMREGQQLHGYRDGADWKFKVEDVERLAQELKDAPPAGADDQGDVLLSEVELGQSDVSSSGTVIGTRDDQSGDADLGSAVSGFEELDLTLDQDTGLESGKLSVEGLSDKPGTDGSTLDLMDGLEDDNLVLGGSAGAGSGSGSGSDITIGGDSGISLVDPTDSGLSLEEPLELVGGSEESLELGEDDMLSLSERADTESPTQVKTDSDFLLTPMEEPADEADSESGSQVIALDEEDSDEAVSVGDSGSMPPMLDEELGAELGMGAVAPLAVAGVAAAPMGVTQDFVATQAAPQAVAALPEAPYSVWNIVSLAFCSLFLALVGMMMFDLLRNMWSWGSPYGLNSWLMDLILGLFGK